MLRHGVSWKINKSIVELWHDSIFDSDSEKSTISLFLDENDKLTASVNIETEECDDQVTSGSEMDDLKSDDKLLGNGSDDVIYQ